MRASQSAYPAFSLGTKSPSHLVLRNGTWHFRMVVPASYRPYLGGLSEFRASLKTGILREARVLAGRLAANAHLVYRHVQRNGSSMAMLDKKTIRTLAKKWLLEGLEHYEADHLSRDTPVPPAATAERKEKLERLATVYQEKLAAGDFSLVSQDWMRSQLEKESRPIPDSNSIEFKSLAAEYMKATIELSKVQAKRAIGDYSDSLILDNSIGNVDNISNDRSRMSAVNANSSPKVCDVIGKYIEEKIRAGSWTERSRDDFVPKLHFFGQRLGNICIDELNKEHIRNFKNIIDTLPSRYGISKKYKKYSLEQIIQMDIPFNERMSISSLGKYYGTINSFLIWMKKNYDGVSDGLSDIMSVKVQVRVDLLRDVFTRDDINKIFSSEIYTNISCHHSYKYWVPLIGYFTGMRLEEICQLYIEDLIVEDGLYCISVNDGKDKRLKTPAANRMVPLHPVLIDKFKFHDFVSKQAQKGCGRIFSELKKQSGRYSHYVSRWFNSDFLVKIGVKTENSKKVFHSFRHTFANYCKVGGIDEFKVREVLGHEVAGQSITYGRYGKKYSSRIIFNEVIDKIKFEIYF
ncbi:DUF6538 domain-containing protein [Solidesulfovibrio sp. C21]|uniref:DUF6538 domain-containing protein n=1 Tax=Solidesulfovibrio sp. C21 TaxID=3398613 RepID=UPI0039FD98D4